MDQYGDINKKPNVEELRAKFAAQTAEAEATGRELEQLEEEAKAALQAPAPSIPATGDLAALVTFYAGENARLNQLVNALVQENADLKAAAKAPANTTGSPRPEVPIDENKKSNKFGWARSLYDTLSNPPGGKK